MQFHQLQPKHKNKSPKRVGRGGKRGKTSGRGTKGQKARSGHSLRPELRDVIKKLPKLRGHGKNRARGVNDSREPFSVVNVGALSVFSSKENITPSTLLSKGLVSRRRGKVPKVKILGTGSINTGYTFYGVVVSTSAKDKIEKAGGKIQ